jgi:hypothetical protein
MLNLMMALTILAQTHTPTATLDNDVVTVEADFATINNVAGNLPADEVEPVTGTILTGSTLLASSDGIAPIAWRVPPGEYVITAFGYPDDRMNPNRVKTVLNVTVTEPTRIESIRVALNELSLRLFEVKAAKQQIQALSPTQVEVLEALSIAP